jgi:GAF domain-containing protein
VHIDTPVAETPVAPLEPAPDPSTLSAESLAWGRGVVDALSRELDFVHCAVFLYDPTVDALRVVAQRWGAADEGREGATGEWLVVPLVGSVCGWVYRSGVPALVADVREHDDYRRYPGSVTRSELAVPILVAGRPVGVLNVESPSVGQFGIRDVHELEAFAARAASALAAAGLC